MQGWHSQRLLGNGEVSDPIIKVWSTNGHSCFVFVLPTEGSWLIENVLLCICRRRMHCPYRNVRSNLKASVWCFTLSFFPCFFVWWCFCVILNFYGPDLLKRKKPPYLDNAVKAARTKPSKPEMRWCYLFALCVSCMRLQFICSLWMCNVHSAESRNSCVKDCLMLMVLLT